MHRILELIEKHSDIPPGEIAVMLDMPEKEVKDAIAQFEKEGIIVGKKTVINWNKTDREYVTAFIELKVTPQQDKGFD
jgi:DNA-binding Lrp family transcriptional regulator